jgi:hypothetical protein
MDVFQLAPNHVWKAAPGCRILVVDNGGVRCDIPYEWIVYSPKRHVFVIDRFPPDSRCMVAISCRRVPPFVNAIPMGWILQEWVNGEEREVLTRTDIVRFYRWPLEGAWLQIQVADASLQYQKMTRVCVARADQTQALIVFDFRAEDEPLIEGVWKTLLGTLAVGDYISDPTTGKRRMKRG